MTKRIKVTGRHGRNIRSTSVTQRRIDPKVVAEALGAELSGVHVGKAPSSAALAELRRNLYTALKSSGGRPALEGTERRQKIPMSDEDWEALREIAASLKTESGGPTAGQVGAQLLKRAIATFLRGAASGEAGPVLPRKDENVHVSDSAITPYVGVKPRDWKAQVRGARLRALEQSQRAVVERTSGVKDRSITDLPISGLQHLFSPPGLPLVDKGAECPTTSVAIYGDAGAGKTTLAVALSHAIARELGGVALYLTTELAPTEISHKREVLSLNNVLVTRWENRAEAQPGGIVSQHLALLENTREGSMKTRALAAAWELVHGAPAEGVPVRCIAIDAFPLFDSGNGVVRDEVVALIQALEGRGISVVIVQEAGGADYVPFVADVVFELTFVAEPDTGELVRRLACRKSRYVRSLVGPHDTGFDAGKVAI